MSTATPGLARPGRVPLVEVVITEELDALGVPRLRALLDEALALRPEHLVVDLAACPLIDAAAITVLLDVHRRAIHSGGQLTLRDPSPRLHRNLQLARVAHALHITRRDTDPVLASDWSAAAWPGVAVDGRPDTAAADASGPSPRSKPPERGEAGANAVQRPRADSDTSSAGR